MTNTEEAVAAAHDLSLPYLAGITDPLLTPLDALPDGAHVVDVACGTGEPSLSLARRRPGLRISGIDTEFALLAAARAKAAEAGLTVEFTPMPMTDLDFADGSVDAITSRMGLLLAGTAPFDAAAGEAARVLRAGGILSLATWTDLAASPYTGIGLPVLRRVLPEGTVPEFEALFADAARPGALERQLANAGFTDIQASWFSWETECPGFESWWHFDTGAGPLKPFFDSLDDGRRASARQAMNDALDEHRTPSGGYRVPATCRMITARR
ncbi:class I SAM-dependent methyltransferase [Amycolatopsis vastitatis]|uniref:class I SAM-dependent methyltransferase n=1 Tax=Amycolatopsis vastitatis TaxID=1905142 RepID=UPI001304521B|nr:class I SAM-dependent methyltransferase [Amycolatopsis vastitatis]